MIGRAKRAIPGVLMTLLLSVPAMAASPHAGAPKTSETALVEKPAVSAIDVKRDGRGSAGQKSSKRLSSKRTQVMARSRVGATTPLVNKSARTRLRRTSALRLAGEHGLPVSDGAAWRIRDGVASEQTGIASWYGGSRWQGHRTSSGSTFNEGELTAAHATLPLGSKVRVTRSDGQRSVIVTINDRPGTRSRIIDLSRAAAKELGMIDSGTAVVTLQPM